MDGEAGFLVEPESAEDLADKLRTLLGDGELRHRMGEVGKLRVQTVLGKKVR
ncbi:glycosyltransferase [Pseudodesulfovibrio methanolicus]|uniref:glycosyltransferase n=1 Tax=Pseudodesulfovibrio methanolicus TaxID=3126690 RepID=UPI003BB1DAC3